ncbi:hypothetical protein FI667_g4958, partial [Globisporangium splendens]
MLSAHSPTRLSTTPHQRDLMAGGSERRSLLDGDIVKRERTAGETVDFFLAKLVDAFNFQIQERCLEAGREAAIAAIARDTSDAYIAHLSSGGGATPSQQQERKQVNLFMRSVSEKLTAFLLNASIDDALQEHPMELGINSKQADSERSSFSWLDRVMLSSEADLLEDDDVFFCTDDESEMLANYETMAYTPQARRARTKA